MEIASVIENMLPLIKTYSVKILAALVIFLAGKWIAGKISRIFSFALEKNKVDISLIKFLESIVYYALLIAVIIAAAGKLGVNTTSFLTIVGAAGLAIALALKDSLSNFASGVMLILFKPFKAGDFVQAAGIAGTVQHISIFNTILHSPDNQKIIAPNRHITDNVITNITANPTRRVDLMVGISYDSDIKKAKSILETLVTSDKRVLADPKPIIAVSELADSSVNLVVRPWVNTSDYWGVYFDLTEKIKLRFDEENISIPFPQQDVHLFSQPVDKPND